MWCIARRLINAAVCTAALLPLHARAEEPKLLPPLTVEAQPPANPLPPGRPGDALLLSPQPSPTGPQQAADGAGHERCVDVTIGNDSSLGCINERLKRKVDQVSPVLNTPPIDAKSSDIKVGTVSIPGVQQQYGKNFGISVIPYRPPSPR